MPLLITPYTFGAQLPAAPGATAGGGAYFLRKRRWVVALLFVLCLVPL